MGVVGKKGMAESERLAVPGVLEGCIVREVKITWSQLGVGVKAVCPWN